MPTHVKHAVSRWREGQNLPALLKRLGEAVPATVGEAKVVAGGRLKGKPSRAPAVESLARLPGASEPVPAEAALKTVRRQQPSTLRRVLEGSGLAGEREYPAFRAQPQPFTGRVVDTGYADSDRKDVMHLAPRATGAEKYFRLAQGALPGHAAIGTFDVPAGTPWYAHMGARAAANGGTPPVFNRHHPEAYEIAVPPKKPLIAYFGQQGPGGQAVETTRIDPDKLEKWYRTFSAPLG